MLIIYNWTCPNCGAKNADSFSATARPLCQDCEVDFDWDEVVVEQKDIDAMNAVLRILEESNPDG